MQQDVKVCWAHTILETYLGGGNIEIGKIEMSYLSGYKTVEKIAKLIYNMLLANTFYEEN